MKITDSSAITEEWIPTGQTTVHIVTLTQIRDIRVKKEDNMGALLFIGLIWFIPKFVSEVFITQVPKGTDYRQVYIDSYSGVSGRTLDRRMSNGYYTKK